MLTSVDVKGAVLSYWGEGRHYFKSEGPKILALLRLTAQKSCPPPRMGAQKIVTLSCKNILSIQMLHRENPYERNYETIFSWNKKSVSIHNIFKNHFFLFVSSITTQQFNNHRTVQ